MIKQVFHFSNRESNSLLAMVTFMLVAVIAPKVVQLYYSYKPDHGADTALLEKQLALLQANRDRLVPLDINSTTAEPLLVIEGITQPLALRILRYRDKLGGFVSVDQYKEVYGLSGRLRAKLIQRTTIQTGYQPKKVSLNRATRKQLAAHPYISYGMAQAIIDYRKREGKFTTLHAIQTLPGYHPDWGKKVMPYLSL
ncbi:ComEA family DNA-binding protein [Cardinium endosymbiont of Encarsia pergandiella]|uniref:ComEA family DNA-binding protein n=1 Tax=Cardinium endosymbiont of Encarsia pergandiella TaxID=249402 RepID=UPI0013054438|nr:helix-hairpin-helix domain-containing protein [Cardinium endosymbiont of Encarsia pergandiella]